MLHLLLGTDWTANRDEVMKRIAGGRCREEGEPHSDGSRTHQP